MAGDEVFFATAKLKKVIFMVWWRHILSSGNCVAPSKVNKVHLPSHLNFVHVIAFVCLVHMKPCKNDMLWFCYGSVMCQAISWQLVSRQPHNDDTDTVGRF